MKSGFLGTFLRIAISLCALALVLFFVRDELKESIRILRSEVIWGWFFLAMATYAAAIAVQTVRLQHVFRVQKVLMNFTATFYLNFVGLFFNLFLPSAVGGDMAKAYYAYKHSGKKIASTTAVILDRLMGFAALILMALTAVLIFSKKVNDPQIDHLIYIFLAIMLLTALFFGSKRFARSLKFLTSWISSPKWRKHLSDIYHAIYGYKKHKGTLLFSIFLSLLGQSLFVLIHYFLAQSLGAILSPWIFFILVPMITIISMAPSIGGLGVREAGAVYLFKRFMPTERALALSLLLDILVYGFSLVGGILYARHGGLKAKTIHEIEEL